MLLRNKQNKSQNASDIFINYAKVGAVFGASGSILWLQTLTEMVDRLDFSQGMLILDEFLYLFRPVVYENRTTFYDIYTYLSPPAFFCETMDRLEAEFAADSQQFMNKYGTINVTNIDDMFGYNLDINQIARNITAQEYNPGPAAIAGFTFLIINGAAFGAIIGSFLSILPVCYVRYRHHLQCEAISEAKQSDTSSDVAVAVNDSAAPQVPSIGNRFGSICKRVGVTKVGLFSAALGGAAAAAAGSFVMVGAGLGFFTSKSVEILRDSCCPSRKFHRG